jgi:WD40 repeat protein
MLLRTPEGTFLQAFDPDRGVVVGKAIQFSDNVSASADAVSAALSVSRTGTVAYRLSNGDGRTRRFVWFDRAGNEISKVGEAGGFSPEISSDGRYIAVSRISGKNPDIFLIETTRGTLSQLTTEPGGNQVSVFSPDGKYVAFSSGRKDYTSPSIFMRAVSEGQDEPLVALPDATVPTHWIADYLLFRKNDKKTGYDIWALPMRGPKAAGDPFPIVQSERAQRDAQFSPDGKWIAYQSDRSGTYEIYVHPFPKPGREQIVSKGGGVQVRWNPNGKELFYIALDGRLMAVPVRSAADGTLDFGVPAALFRTSMGPVFWGVHKQQYVVSDNGQKFLINTTATGDLSPIYLIQHWQPDEK